MAATGLESVRYFTVGNWPITAIAAFILAQQQIKQTAARNRRTAAIAIFGYFAQSAQYVA